MRLANRNGKISRGVRRRLFLEGLASRYLLAGVTAEVLDDIATISGSSANDEVVIAPMTLRDEVHVFANGQCISAWRQSEVREITVQSLGGDDLIRVADSVPGAVKITGGVGRDTVLIDRPHDHRNGWLFDVEQVMAEGEFASASAVGNDAHSQHTGHGTSNASSQMQLFPIPTDHLHVDLQPESIHEVAPAVHEHGTAAETSITPVPDTSADPSVLPVQDTTSEISPITEPEHGSTHDAPEINLPTTALDRELILPGSDLSITPHTSHIDQEAELDTLNDTTGISSTLEVIRSDPEPGEHAGHDPFAISTDAPASSEHAGHGTSAGSTDVLASSEHTGHGTSAGSPGGGEHSGHAGLNASAGSTIGGEHAGHSGQGASAGSTGGLGHSGHTLGVTSTGHEHGSDAASTIIHAGHADHVEELVTIEPGSATAHKSGHHDQAAGNSRARHGANGHDHAAGQSGVGPLAGVLTGTDAHSGHRCERTQGTPGPASGADETEQAHQASSVPACHSATGGNKTDAAVPEPDAGTSDGKGRES